MTTVASRGENGGNVPSPLFVAPFADALDAVRWGTRQLAGAVTEPGLAQREARWLLEAAAVSAGRDPLFLNPADLTQRTVAVFRSHVARRARGEPLAYVIGEANFCGLDFFVTADVLIPRPETEQLVELVLTTWREASARVLDVGTGSGAMAVSLAVERSQFTVTATDVSAAAVDLARRNAARHGVADRVTVLLSDLWPDLRPDLRPDLWHDNESQDEASENAVSKDMPWEYDVLVANLPYVADDEPLPSDVADWEPRGALRGGKIGTELIERAVETAERRSGGRTMAFFEIGETQENRLAERFPGRFTFHRDLTGRTRFMTGRI